MQPGWRDRTQAVWSSTIASDALRLTESIPFCAAGLDSYAWPAAMIGVLLRETVWLAVPLTQSMAITALIMAASTLLPVRPLDGAKLGKKGPVAGAGVVAAGTLIILGLG